MAAGSCPRGPAAASACPTFSCSGVDGAAGYELVVYEAPVRAGSAAAPSRAASAEPVLRTRIRGGGYSWTPPADDCLALAGGYAWSVRAGGLAAVLERVLGRYLESRGLRYGRNG